MKRGGAESPATEPQSPKPTGFSVVVGVLGYRFPFRTLPTARLNGV